MRYVKNSPRLNVRFFDGDTDEYLFDIKDINWMDVGQFFTDHYVDQLVKRTLGDDIPDKVMVIVDAEYNLM